MTIYYVYAYVRKKDSKTAKAGTPYYIGKGSYNRAYVPHNNVPRPNKSHIIILEKNLTEVGAFALERRMIRWYGRKDSVENPGILLNRTDGGEGLSGAVPSEQSRIARREKMLGKKQSPEEIERKRQRQLGQKHTPERNAKRSAALKGRKLSAEHIAKRSETVRGRKQSADIVEKRVSQLRGRPQQIIVCPHCNMSGGNIVMKRHHFERCKHKPETSLV